MVREKVSSADIEMGAFAAGKVADELIQLSLAAWTRA
jgi:hypothetical protein